CRGPAAAAFGTEMPQRSCSLLLSSSLLGISIWRLVTSLQVSCCRTCTGARPYGRSVAVFMSTPTRGVCDACCARRGDWPSGGSAAKKRVMGSRPRMSAPGKAAGRIKLSHLEGLVRTAADGLPARADLVLRFGLEIAGVMALVQLFFRRPAGAIDHSPALDGRALTDFLRPACQVFILVRLQERARVVVGGAVQHAVAVPRP